MAEGEELVLLIEVPALTHLVSACIHTRACVSTYLHEGSFALYDYVNVIVFCQVCVLQTFLHLGCFQYSLFLFCF